MIHSTRPVAASAKCPRIRGGRIRPLSRWRIPPRANQMASMMKPPPAVRTQAINAAHSIPQRLLVRGGPFSPMRHRERQSHRIALLPSAQTWKVGVEDQFCENTRNGAAGALLHTELRSHMKRRGGTMAKSVRDAMTEDPRSIGASASVVEAARLMREQHVGSLPITDDEKLVGMITDRDITTRVVAEAADPKMTSVGDVYSRDLISVEPDKDLEEALQLMARHQVRRLPVVENGRLVGIVAQADIALRENEKKTGELVEAISEPSEEERR